MSSKKNLEGRTRDALKKKTVKRNYFMQIMGYIMDGIKPSDKVSPTNKIVYSRFYD